MRNWGPLLRARYLAPAASVFLSSSSIAQSPCEHPIADLSKCPACPASPRCRRAAAGYTPSYNGCGPEKFAKLIQLGVIPQGYGPADFANGGCQLPQLCGCNKHDICYGTCNSQVSGSTGQGPYDDAQKTACECCSCAWSGSSTSTVGPLTITANPVTWTFDHSDGTKQQFKAVSGTVVEAESSCTISPDTWQIDSSNAATTQMAIDYGQTPPSFLIIAGTRWTGCVSCGVPPITSCGGLGGPWCGDPVNQVKGFVSQDGGTIEGTTGTIPAYSWKFMLSCPQ